MVSTHYIPYLIELRKRLLTCFYLSSILFLGVFYFSNRLFDLIALPILQQLPHDQHLIATHVAAPLIVPLKFSVYLTIFMCIPIYCYQAWKFLRPALYTNEKRLIFLLLLPSIFLFYLGIFFAYAIVLPLIFKFFTQVSPHSVNLMPDISQYLEFVLQLFFAFGVAFEVPIITCLIILSGMISKKNLAAKRPYVIVAAFIIGMLLTPPDVISQILLAIPICLLFECGLFMAKIIKLPLKSGSSQ